jgi:6-pyruvoyltetrahydropterin/6-carboxytetrahydropterin synthase
VDCQNTDEIGMAIDFGVLKDHLNELMEYLDHQFLNEIEPFDKLNPTSENIARYLYQQLSARLNDQNARVQEIEVWENDNSSAIYFE